LASFRNYPWRNCTSDNIGIYDYYVVSEHAKSTGFVIYVSDAVTSSPPHGWGLRCSDMDEYQIVELVKDWYREGHRRRYYVLLNGNNIGFVPPPSFHESNKQGQISDRIIGLVYLFGTRDDSITLFEFPMFGHGMQIVELFVYRRGYVLVDQPHGRYPLPNLKYYIFGAEYENRLAIELVDLDVVGNNLNLPKIMSSVLGSKLLTKKKMNKDEFYEIWKQMHIQKLFADHTWYDAQDIVRLYFVQNDRELSKEVFKILQAYERVFRPYRIVYDTKTWQPVLM